MDVRLYNLCCNETVVSITCYECVFLALGIQDAKRMCHIVVCDLSGSTVFVLHYLTNIGILGRNYRIQNVF